jgi:hypothetical protein
MTMQRPLASFLPALAGSALAVGFGAAALLRRRKPLHPDGTVWDATVRRSGAAQRWGSAWLDEAGTDRGLARLSRSVGLPDPVPDILGLALTFEDPAGTRHDLLLSSTGLRPVTRFVLLPRRNAARAGYGCLLPYKAPTGPVMIAAIPVPASARQLVFQLVAASPGGRWQPFGRLELTARADPEPDLPVRFDPILHPLPGLAYYPALRRVREPAYAAARRFSPALAPRRSAGKVTTA